MQKTHNAKGSDVLTSVRLPRHLHAELENFKARFGIPYNQMICRGVELVTKQFASELKNPGTCIEA